MIGHTVRSLLLCILVLSPQFLAAQGFTRVSYGNDLLSTGGGARALGMGGAFTGIADDVTAGFWNPAGLVHVESWQVSYMHSERFNGLVAYDYGALAHRLSDSEAVVSLSFFRQGVDNIKNTLNAWDKERDRPRANPDDYITEFNTSDAAFLMSYAAPLRNGLSWGTSVKLLYSRLGPFANAWGYSFDAGLLFRNETFSAGITLVDATSLIKFWIVNEHELEPLREYFSDEMLNEQFPKGLSEVTLPSLRLGFGKYLHLQDIKLTGSVDLDMLFEGRQTYALHLGNTSFHPRAGLEAGYLDALFLRLGIADVTTDRSGQVILSPTMGTGLRLGGIQLDYGFGSFAGASAILGYTHRISALFVF